MVHIKGANMLKIILRGQNIRQEMNWPHYAKILFFVSHPGSPNMTTRVLEAEAEAAVFVSRFQIGGWDSN